MAKLNIPAKIAAAIKAGKTVIWTQRGAYDYKKGECKLLVRINEKAATYEQIDVILGNLSLTWQDPRTVYVGNKLYGLVPPQDLYVDVELYLSEYYQLDYSTGKDVRWFKGDLESVAVEPNWEGGYEMCWFDI